MRELFQGVQIALVVAGLVDGGFEDEGFAAEFGMAQDAAEPFQPDVAFADGGVTIDARTERRFGIVGVNQVDVF